MKIFPVYSWVARGCVETYVLCNTDWSGLSRRCHGSGLDSVRTESETRAKMSGARILSTSFVDMYQYIVRCTLPSPIVVFHPPRRFHHASKAPPDVRCFCTLTNHTHNQRGSHVQHSEVTSDMEARVCSRTRPATLIGILAKRNSSNTSCFVSSGTQDPALILRNNLISSPLPSSELWPCLSAFFSFPAVSPPC